MKYAILISTILILSSCGGSSPSEETTTPIVVTTPNNPTQGTVLEETCNDTTLVQTIADGNGGSTQNTIPNSEACGYEAPPQFGAPLGTAYCANRTQNTFNNLLAVIQNLRQYDKVQDYADGEGGSYTEVVETDVEDCGYEQVQEEGTPIGDSYCANTVAYGDFEQYKDTINHLLPEDRLQDYADGEGGSYTDRVVHIDQSCFIQMAKPDECPTDWSAGIDSRYNWMTCDGILQKSDVSFPYQPNATDSGVAIIDMLIVFDSNISEQQLDGMTIEEFVDKQFYDANHIYMLSGVHTLLRVAGIKIVDVANGDLYRQYAAFFNGRQEFRGLDQWQQEAGADMAFLFKAKPTDAIACGVASLDATRGLDKTRGILQCYHNTVFQSTPSTRYYERAHETFPHEVGHLLGASHEWNDTDSPGLFEHSYGYNLPGFDLQSDNPDYAGVYGGYGTIMSYADRATGRFSDPTVTCIIPETGQSVALGTDGGCFCLDDVEDHPPPTNNTNTIQRTRWLMSQLHELDHSIQRQSPVFSIQTHPDICLF
jgi:hypothetical protein